MITLNDYLFSGNTVLKILHQYSDDLKQQAKEKHSFTIKKEDAHFYSVDAPWLAPILSTVNMDDYESLQYFQRVLRYSGIIDALLEAGIEEEDTVSIFDFEFSFVN